MANVPGTNEMFVKLACVIVCAGVTGMVLLSLRQDRLQAANEFAEARLRVRMFNEQVSTIRAELATQITPDRIEAMADELGVRTQSWLRPPPAPLPPPELLGDSDTQDVETDDESDVEQPREGLN